MHKCFWATKDGFVFGRKTSKITKLRFLKCALSSTLNRFTHQQKHPEKSNASCFPSHLESHETFKVTSA